MTTSFRLGDKPVNRIGFGAMQLAGPGVFGPPRDVGQARAVLRRAVELGVDHIDTAQYYGPDVVNELIRDALYPYSPNLRLVTKVGARRDAAGAWLPALSPAEFRTGVEDNLRALQAERMDLVNLRLADGAGNDSHLAEQLGTLVDLREEGKLDLIGLSNAGAKTIRRALELVDLAEVQNGYSILDRRHEAVVNLCAKRQIAFVPFFPLGSAFTAGPASLARDRAITNVARRHGVTPAQIALAWLLQRGEHILLIPGTSSVTHLEENIGAGNVELGHDDLTLLDGVAQLADPLGAV